MELEGGARSLRDHDISSGNPHLLTGAGGEVKCGMRVSKDGTL